MSSGPGDLLPSVHSGLMAVNPPSLPLLPCLRRRMGLGTQLLLLCEAVPGSGHVFPHFPPSRAPCALCASSHLCVPISIPCFSLCILSPSLLALCGLIPVFPAAFGSLSCICHQSNMALPCFSSQCSQSSAKQGLEPWSHHIPVPAVPTGLGLSHLHVPGNMAQ